MIKKYIFKQRQSYYNKNSDASNDDKFVILEIKSLII